jgi:hypothetical protein
VRRAFGPSCGSTAAIRLDAGEEAGAGELPAAMRDNVRRRREAGEMMAGFDDSVDYEEGIADYLAGEHKKGLELIANAAEGCSR